MRRKCKHDNLRMVMRHPNQLQGSQKWLNKPFQLPSLLLYQGLLITPHQRFYLRLLNVILAPMYDTIHPAQSQNVGLSICDHVAKVCLHSVGKHLLIPIPTSYSA